MSLTLPPGIAGTPVGGDERRRAVRLRVLNAASGTIASERSTAVAAAIAAERDAELFVVHVTAPIELRVTRLGPTVARAGRLDDPYAEPVLLQARQVAWANGALARVVLMIGHPAEAILAAARDLRVDVIAIGARPVRMPAFIAAPTRFQLQRDAHVPVLAVTLAGELARDADGRAGGVSRS